MKVNEAPEKIILSADRDTQIINYEWVVNDYTDNIKIEYVRKDAFIKKALKWYCLDCECNDNCNADYKCFFRQEYKRYLEGNNNAIPPKFDNAINPDGSVTENYRYRHFIRKVRDAFIEKAVNFLEMLGCGFTITDNITHANYGKEQLIEDFRKYMEGE